MNYLQRKTIKFYFKRFVKVQHSQKPESYELVEKIAKAIGFSMDSKDSHV